MSAAAQIEWKPPAGDWTPPTGDRQAAAPPDSAAQPGYLSQVGHGLWNTVKGLASVAGEGIGVTLDPSHVIEHMANLKRMILDPQVDQAMQAAEKWKSGDHSEAVGHALAAILPGVGPAAANIGEKAGAGDFTGAAADATTLGVTMAAPHFVGPVAEAVAPGAKAVVAGVKAAAPDVVTGAVKLAGGEALAAAVPGTGYLGRVALAYPGLRQIKAGIGKGWEAGQASFADKLTNAADALTAATPGEALAKAQGIEWAKLSPEDQGIMENVAKAQQTAPERGAPPTLAPPPASAPTPVVSQPQAPGAPPQSLAEMLRAEMEAARAPAPEAPQALIGGHPAANVQPRGYTPIRPPLRPPVTQPEAAPVPPAPPASPQPAPSSATAPPATPPPAEPSLAPAFMSEDAMRRFMRDNGVSEEDARATLQGQGFKIVDRSMLNRALHGIGNEMGLDHRAVSDAASLRYGVKSMTQLSQDQLLAMYEDMQGKRSISSPLEPKTPDPKSAAAAAYAQQLHNAGITPEEWQTVTPGMARKILRKDQAPAEFIPLVLDHLRALGATAK